ncbi:hypothetical protein B0H15DRAFT_803429 [Mycena belliarum]|uniref:Uncharacterized protein n=1 Tax=Mycena belliarum TaxID=1033014 RepID=A0AAD6U221_9AGAR|nr:hypothetical protein B0H15DRAFT_803429 [Mycena belliae]
MGNLASNSHSSEPSVLEKITMAWKKGKQLELIIGTAERVASANSSRIMRRSVLVRTLDGSDENSAKYFVDLNTTHANYAFESELSADTDGSQKFKGCFRRNDADKCWDIVLLNGTFTWKLRVVAGKEQLQMQPVPTDDSTKTITPENLPQLQWFYARGCRNIQRSLHSGPAIHETVMSNLEHSGKIATPTLPLNRRRDVEENLEMDWCDARSRSSDVGFRVRDAADESVADASWDGTASRCHVGPIPPLVLLLSRPLCPSPAAKIAFSPAGSSTPLAHDGSPRARGSLLDSARRTVPAGRASIAMVSVVVESGWSRVRLCSGGDREPPGTCNVQSRTFRQDCNSNSGYLDLESFDVEPSQKLSSGALPVSACKPVFARRDKALRTEGLREAFDKAFGFFGQLSDPFGRP